MLRRVPLLIIAITTLLGLGFRNLQLAQVDFVDIDQTWVFGETINFQGAVQTPANVQEAALFIKPASSDTRTSKVQLNPGGGIDHTFSLSENPFRAFTPVEYWYQVTLDTGEVVNSPVYSFLYEDNRFDWRRIESDQFKIAWISGEQDFGQTIQNASENSLAAARAILAIEAPSPIRIYVYPSSQDMQSAVQLSSKPWAAGHSNPDLNLILVSIPEGPDAIAEMERQIPHELMHILEYQIIGPYYNQAPVWLLEGLASTAELYPNPEYQQVIQNAVDNDGLIPLSLLCEEFPRDLSGVILAYAESSSFVNFLHQNYGSSGITTLLNHYKDGQNCKAGIEAAFGTTFSELETRWQKDSLGHNVRLSAWKKLLPYFVVALFILVPFGLSFIPIRRKTNNLKEVGR